MVREVRIEPLTTERHFAEAVALQKTIWGFEDIELLPVRLFIVATKVGGQAFGAYAEDRMIGFCLAIPGLKPGGRSYLHSHMTGESPRLLFMHFWAVDDAMVLARGLRAALDAASR